MIWPAQLYFGEITWFIFLLIMDIKVHCMDHCSEMMGSSRASLFFLLCSSPLCSFFHFFFPFFPHFPHFIYTCLFSFRTFSSLSLLLPFSISSSTSSPPPFSSMHSPSLSGKTLWKSWRSVTGWKQQEMRVQKQRGSSYSWNGVALSAKAEKEWWREKECACLKSSLNWDQSSSAAP